METLNIFPSCILFDCLMKELWLETKKKSWGVTEINIVIVFNPTKLSNAINFVEGE